jgi:hypothetical protein
MPRTKLTEKYGKPTKTEEPIKIEVDEATGAQREADTLAWLAEPSNQRALEEGRLALEMELAEAEKKRQRRRQADAEPDTETDEPWPLPAHVVAQIEPGGAPVWSASAKLEIPPRDPDDPRDGWQVLDVTVELHNRFNGYVFVVVMPDGSRDELPPVETRDGWAGDAAYRRIKIAEDADWAAFNALPQEHPVKERRAQRDAERAKAYLKSLSNCGAGAPRREMYRDRDLVTGEFTSYSDGHHTWR